MALAPPYGFHPETGKGFTDNEVNALINRLQALDPRYIFFFEISDVLKPDPPLYHGSPYDAWSKAQPSGTPARSNWVQCARTVPYVGRNCGRDVQDARDMGAARVAEIARAVFSTGFRGESRSLAATRESISCACQFPFPSLIVEQKDAKRIHS